MLPCRHVVQERRAWSHQVLHPIRTDIAGEHVFDFGDLAIHHFEAQGDDVRPVVFLHDAVEAGLVRRGIDGVNLEGGGSFRRAHPQAVADGNLRGVFGEPDATR